LHLTGETFAVQIDIFIGNARVIIVSSDDPMVTGIEAPFDNITDISLDLGGSELMTRLISSSALFRIKM
jgi:hypothetical protein